ncbi:hypothetical protein H4Q32_008285 [Labeo rohita]|uniref:Uncharacterized protein n=1 Tax=Labeo rohita TaxID=84645 RepID=A0ABQ8MES6_LABRO|nr:hypothetical protein H4Q32_008285 [Labeo rohita]
MRHEVKERDESEKEREPSVGLKRYDPCYLLKSIRHAEEKSHRINKWASEGADPALSRFLFCDNDSENRETLWKINRAYEIPSQFVDIFCNLYQGSRCCVQMEEGITDFFAIKTGVWVYSSLSSTSSPATPSTTYTSAYLGQLVVSSLPISTLPTISSKNQENQAASAGLRINGQKTKIIHTALRNLTMALENQTASAGLRINKLKTKVLCIAGITGVRQGCMLSLMLFLLVINFVADTPSTTYTYTSAYLILTLPMILSFLARLKQPYETSPWL